jgi:hypothetical protein
MSSVYSSYAVRQAVGKPRLLTFFPNHLGMILLNGKIPQFWILDLGIINL